MPYSPKIARRTTLKWMLAGIGSAPLVAACGGADGPASNTPLLGTPRPISGSRYGTDPDLLDPQILWQRTMTTAQLALAAALCDVIIPAGDNVPAASELGVPEFIDEWVSSPYDLTQDDRTACFKLFEWLETEAQNAGASSFSVATIDTQTTLLDRIAWRDRVEDGLDDQADGFARFRKLALSAYFASEPGSQWLGYIGNRPAMGDYAGPTREALDHLEQALIPLGLSIPEDL